MSDVRDIDAALRLLLSLLDAQIEELKALRAEFAQRAEVRAAHGYLATWFPSRTEALERQRDVLQRLRQEGPTAAARERDGELVHALGWFRSLGQGFDVDLGWSERGQAVFVRLGEMQRRASELRASIRAAPTA